MLRFENQDRQRVFFFRILVTLSLCVVLNHALPLQAEVHGPELPRPLRNLHAGLGVNPGHPVPSRPPAIPFFQASPQRSWLSYGDKERDGTRTIERVSGEEKGPRIPEPMVFDLVRPLGAKRGEGEVNVLGLVPLTRKTRIVDDAPDPLGLVRRSADVQGIEWAPEIEYAFRDDAAIELELPMENSRVEAYKAAGQVTFGTAFKNTFIHGAQIIVQYDRRPALWTSTFLYLAGFRLNKTWSMFGMFGPRAELVGAVDQRKVEWLSNVTLFADVTDRLVGGVETNFGQVIDGHAALLLMPQLHYEVDAYWMVQFGVGARFTRDFTLPEVGFRVVREF